MPTALQVWRPVWRLVQHIGEQLSPASSWEGDVKAQLYLPRMYLRRAGTQLSPVPEWELSEEWKWGGCSPQGPAVQDQI